MTALQVLFKDMAEEVTKLEENLSGSKKEYNEKDNYYKCGLEAVVFLTVGNAAFTPSAIADCTKSLMFRPLARRLLSDSCTIWIIGQFVAGATTADACHVKKDAKRLFCRNGDC
uniref:Ground-like domain-containing protein n=1 Tax=Heterorhabditis bacteriophora TaxID=37862 RepID=A0A1I7XVF8_HETBA